MQRCGTKICKGVGCLIVKRIITMIVIIIIGIMMIIIHWLSGWPKKKKTLYLPLKWSSQKV